MASEFVPTREDVYAAREILKRKLPPELGLDVLYQAGYWPCMTSELCEQIQVSQGGRICVFEEIVGREEFDYEPACRIAEVQFEIEGHDQGWTSEDTEGTYSTSSWFEVSILRRRRLNDNTAPFPVSLTDLTYENLTWANDAFRGKGWEIVPHPADVATYYPQDQGRYAWYLQGNKVTCKEPVCKISWGPDGTTPRGNEGSGKGEKFVDSLRPGDVVVVWARAKWPGWTNTAKHVKMSVCYTF